MTRPAYVLRREQLRCSCCNWWIDDCRLYGCSDPEVNGGPISELDRISLGREEAERRWKRRTELIVEAKLDSNPVYRKFKQFTRKLYNQDGSPLTLPTLANIRGVK